MPQLAAFLNSYSPSLSFSKCSYRSSNTSTKYTVSITPAVYPHRQSKPISPAFPSQIYTPVTFHHLKSITASQNLSYARLESSSINNDSRSQKPPRTKIFVLWLQSDPVTFHSLYFKALHWSSAHKASLLVYASDFEIASKAIALSIPVNNFDPAIASTKVIPSHLFAYLRSTRASSVAFHSIASTNINLLHRDLHLTFQQQALVKFAHRSAINCFPIALKNTPVTKYLPFNTPAFSTFSLSMASLILASIPPLITEYDHNGVAVNYFTEGDRLQSGVIKDDRSLKKKFYDWFKAVYLPYGYPHSVTKDYLSFSLWRAVQNVASGIMGVLSTEALLFGLGLGKLGSKGTAATAAATSWVLKDGLGYVGKVIYGYVAGKHFDYDPKSWRLFADVVEDLGGVLEVLTPLYPGNFLPMASVANMLKGVSAMTGTATRHTIYKSLAIRENQGDIATKGESQGVTCKMLSLGLGIAVSTRLGQNYFTLLAAYSGFALVHLFANWQSMSCVQFTTLNRQRSKKLMDSYFKRERLPTPYDLSQHEKIIIPPWKDYQSNIIIGDSVRNSFQSKDQLVDLKNKFKNEKYLMSVCGDKVYIVLKEGAQSLDALCGYFAAQRYLSDPKNISVNDAHSYAKKNFSKFLHETSKAGWNIGYSQLAPKSYRAAW